MADKKLWFKNKLYGWGWTPCSWEGWTVLFVYFVALVGIFVNVDHNSHSGSDTLIGISPHFIILTICLIIICYFTGEKPRWRWGK